jgi:hypothetical protein
VNSKVLAIHGEFLLVPGTEHGFLKAQSYREMANWLDTPAKRDKVRNGYNPEVGRLTLQWLEKVRRN